MPHTPTPQNVRVNDVVQIDGTDPTLAYCFLTVTEVKSWGVQGFVKVPQPPVSADAYYRVPFDRLAKIGVAEWAPAKLA